MARYVLTASVASCLLAVGQSLDPACPMAQSLSGGHAALWVQASASISTKAELTAIDSYTSALDRFINTKPQARMFGDVSAPTDRTGRWREFRSKAELEKAAGENQSAFVWTRRGKVVAAHVTFTNASGDWAHLIMYYFREDGTLAKIQAQLNTFVSSYGGVSVLRDSYYDARGKLLNSTQKYLDLETQKPIKPQGYEPHHPIPVYRKVSELPFWRML